MKTTTDHLRTLFRQSVLPLILFNILAAITTNASLVGWYRLEEGAIDPNTNTTWDAVSGSANYGTLNPVGGTLTWVTTGLGRVPAPGTTAAVQLTPPAGANGKSGVDPYIPTTLMTQDQTGNGLAGGGARTISAWIFPATTQVDANACIVNMGPATPNGARCTFRIISGSGGYVLRCEFQGGGKSGTKNLCDGNWHFVAVVMTNNATVAGVTLYVDGVQEAISVSSGLTLAINVYTNYPVVIGSTTGSGLGDRGFTGLIDDVRIYNQALASSDIINLYLGPGVAPSLTKLASQSLVLGSTNSAITFNAGAVGTPPLNLQWKFNGLNLAGQTNDALTISPALAANAGTYMVAVTNAYGGTNASVQLRLNTAPINPPRQAVLAGQPASFSVTMPSDSSGYTYQWLANGTNLVGATNATLTLAGASAANAGTNYQVVAALGANYATSSPPASLSVLSIPSSLYARFVLGDVPAGYWRLDEPNSATVAADQTGFYPGVYYGYTGSELGQLGALTNDADTASSFTGLNYMQVPLDPQLTSSNGLTLEIWANPSSIGAAQDLIACFGGTPTWGYVLSLSAAGNPVFTTYNSVSSAAPASTSLTATTALTAGLWAHVVATYDGTTQRLYVNGVLAGTQTATYIPVGASSGIGVRFGAGMSNVGAIASPFTGLLDEAAIYSKVLAVQQIQNHYEAGVLGSGVPPTITAQPVNQSVILGSTNTTVSFSVTAGGSPPIFYQWQQNGLPLPGMTSSQLTLVPFVPADLGTYAVSVTNGAGGLLSSNASLKYTTGPILPSAQAVFTGTPATFTLTGMPGYQAYTYQWAHAGTNLPGATTATLTLPAAGAVDAGNYTMAATLGTDSATSAPVALFVLAPPTRAYSNIVSSDLPVGWWRLDDAPGSTIAAETISGVDVGSVYPDVTLGVEGALLGDADTCAAFTGYSQGARAGNSRIDVAYDPALNPSVFSVECWALVTGGAGNYRSAVTSRDTTTGTAYGYTLYAANDNTWQFWLGNGTTWVAVSGPAIVANQWAHLVGTYDGATASLYVNGVLASSRPVAYVPNAAQRLSIGAGATETVSGNYFFLGRLDEVAVYANALSVAQVQAHYAAAFQPGAAPRFTAQPLSRAALAGDSFTLGASVHQTPPTRLQWQQNGTNLPSATNATLLLSPLSSAQAGSYQLVATHGSASATNPPANLQVITGQAVSVNLEGFENVQTVAGNGGYAGYVRVTNWNEIAYGSDAGTVTNLINHQGHTNAVVVSWSASNNRHWNGLPQQAYASDDALLGGFLEAVTGSDVIVTITGIPAAYQAAGYAVYAYFGEPSATVGMVNAANAYGQVSLGATTNYYHSIDLATWDGNYLPAVTTDPFAATTSDANYAVFDHLNSASVTLTVGAHPTQPGPASLSGFQIIAYVATPAAVPLQAALQGNTVVLFWTGTWVLQQRNGLSGGSWTDVTGAASPYSVPSPLANLMFFRLRSP